MQHLTFEQQTLLGLLRQSLWGEAPTIPEEVNWEVIDTFAKEQAVISFVYDGAVKTKAGVPAEILQKWKHIMLHGVVNNERLFFAQDQIVNWFEEDHIPAVVLKGSSVSRYYPQPELRVLGDIDVLVNEADVEKAKTILEHNGYLFVESDHGFHISLSRKGICVELHYHVTGFPDSEGGQIAKKEAAHFLDHIDQGTVSHHVFPALAETDQALSLLLHMIRHMFGSGIGLRQLCDWAMYIVSADPDHFATVTIPMLKRCGLEQYAHVATKTCVRYLGLPDEKLSWCADVTDEECRAFIDEIFHGGNMGEANKEGMGSLFTDSSTMGEERSALCALISRLTVLSYKNFPVSEKYKVLLPIFWVYLPVRYLVRSKLGLRPKKSVAKVVASAKQQRTLYEMLKPFDVEQ